MAASSLNRVLPHLRRTVFAETSFTDGQLLECFLQHREEAAFAALVRRHGAMVLGVCRRLLHNPHDADDAFQAAFLVLVRRAPTLLARQTVGNWLYGVAYHTALKARAAARKRRAKEAQVATRLTPTAPTEVESDWRSLLDEELHRLPAKYRDAIVLCDLEGKTRREAAAQLGVAVGTLSGRLTTARRLLARRLSSRGVTLGAVALAGLGVQAAKAGVPPALAGITVRAAVAVAAGQATPAGVISSNVARLTEGVVRVMALKRWKLTGLVLLLLVVLGAGAYVLAHPGPAEGQPAARGPAAPPPAAATESLRGQIEALEWVVSGVDEDKRTVLVYNLSRSNVIDWELPPLPGFAQAFYEKTRPGSNLVLDWLPVAPEATITIDGKAAKLTDVRAGMKVTLGLAKEGLRIARMTGSMQNWYVLKSVDVAKGTVSVNIEWKNVALDGLRVMNDAKIVVEEQEGKLADLKAGMRVSLRIRAEEVQFVVTGIRAAEK